MEENNFFQLINRYTNNDSCLFITTSNKIVRVHCPFRVVCCETTSVHKQGYAYIVTKVFSTDGHSILYKIGDDVHPHRHFKLILSIG